MLEKAPDGAPISRPDHAVEGERPTEVEHDLRRQ
jgi:hypothetical protein